MNFSDELIADITGATLETVRAVLYPSNGNGNG